MAVRRRIYRQGNSAVISLPTWALDYCKVEVGDYFVVEAMDVPGLKLLPEAGGPMGARGGGGGESREERSR